MWGGGKIYIKIMDVMLKNKQDEERYKEIFADICDSFNIETLVPLVQNDIPGLKNKFDKNYWNEKVTESLICPQPFYLMVVTPEGVVLPCCEEGLDFNLGQVSEKLTIVDIWNGDKMKETRSMMIQGNREKHSICGKCNVVKYQTSIMDNLDAYAERLKELYK